MDASPTLRTTNCGASNALPPKARRARTARPTRSPPTRGIGLNSTVTTNLVRFCQHHQVLTDSVPLSALALVDVPERFVATDGESVSLCFARTATRRPTILG